MSKNIYFDAYNRVLNNHSPTLICERLEDRFTISSSIGNGKLSKPIGLITADEAMYAGAVNRKANDLGFYLYTNQWYWVFTGYYFTALSKNATIRSDGANSYDDSDCSYSVRPVISLSSSSSVADSGDGTMENPYVVITE